MKFGIRGRHVELTEAVLAHVERRLRFVLSRFGPKIRQIAMKLTDLNGPRSGFNKQCRITATLSPSGKVRVEATDAQLHSAIDLATDRLDGSVTRELERRSER